MEDKTSTSTAQPLRTLLDRAPAPTAQPLRILLDLAPAPTAQLLRTWLCHVFRIPAHEHQRLPTIQQIACNRSIAYRLEWHPGRTG